MNLYEFWPKEKFPQEEDRKYIYLFRLARKNPFYFPDIYDFDEFCNFHHNAYNSHPFHYMRTVDKWLRYQFKFCSFYPESVYLKFIKEINYVVYDSNYYDTITNIIKKYEPYINI